MALRPATSRAAASTSSASRAGQHANVLPYTHRDARTTSRMEIGGWSRERRNRATAGSTAFLQRHCGAIECALAGTARQFFAL